MQTLDDFAVNHYLNVSTRPYPDYVKVAYLLEVVQELEQRLEYFDAIVPKLSRDLAKLERAATRNGLLEQQPVEQGTIVWPDALKVCRCEDGFLGSEWECERCHGGRF